LCVYSAATIGTFAALDYLGQPSRSIDGIEELAGLGRVKPLPAAMIAVFMFSLTGIPLLPGFWGKLLIFGSALNIDSQAGGNIRIWFIALAIIGVLNAAVSAGYYLRIVGIMYFRAPSESPKAEGGFGAWTAALACLMLTIILGVYPWPLLKASNQARPIIAQEVKVEKAVEK
jgi:NADH-quinone oxidoreductase subunit N